MELIDQEGLKMERRFDENIPNIDSYCFSMEKSILDKILFMSHVNANIIIDYGCADGFLIEYLSNLFPGIIFIGYDISAHMINLAKKRLCKKLNVILLTSNWSEIEEFIQDNSNKDMKSCLLLSSVLHEVYSYNKEDPEYIFNFWTTIAKAGVDYISIRDMYYNPNLDLIGTSIKEVLESIKFKYRNKFEDYINNIKDLYSRDKIYINNKIVEFLLKYFYEDNWEREKLESYLNEEVDKDISEYIEWKYRYKKIFEIKYTLPFIAERVYKDFGIDLVRSKILTHYQYIFKIEE